MSLCRRPFGRGLKDGQGVQFIIYLNNIIIYQNGSRAGLNRAARSDNQTNMQMQITKRNGELRPYDSAKIAEAIRKSFRSLHREVDEARLAEIVAEVEAVLVSDPAKRAVECIQDLVEQRLMAHGFYEEAKSYILFRAGRTEERRTMRSIAEMAGDEGLLDTLGGIRRDFSAAEGYDMGRLLDKFTGFLTPSMRGRDRLTALVKAAVELTTKESPKWEYIAGRLLAYRLEGDIRAVEEREGITSVVAKVDWLTGRGLLGSYIREGYITEELTEAATYIVPTRDLQLNYSGLDMLMHRYLIRTHDGQIVERVQEMFLGIALHLALREEKDRMAWVRRFYDMLSLLQVTMATPTMANARKPFHQLSSCFIDTVPDSLEGIYRSIGNFAQVSKYGGGMGMYFGKVRAAGSTIRGFKGAAGGVIRWIKLVNDTAVAVDQLGVRQGAVAVYLDAWHKDLPEFLSLRTNNGDDRMKAHDVFPAVCYPDLFWRWASEDIDHEWHMFCPHEIETLKGYALEDYWGEEWEKRYLDCVADKRLSRRVMRVKDIVRLVLRSAVETGTPFAFNRDTVNRLNPNPHKGMIYCSNLCTEIAQNMSAIGDGATETRVVDGETVVVSTTKPGYFVVCNLASLSLGHLPLEDEQAMRHTIETAVRALDNVIDLNFYPLPYARLTNREYRSIGLGVSGYHHALAKRGIAWESEEHLRFADTTFELINRLAIEASARLAAEKGACSVYDGSEWQSGEYFTKRGYTSPEWQRTRALVSRYGMRNAYIMAVAPTSSTSIIAGTTAGIDPVMKRFYLEEKKGAILPRVAPELSSRTWWPYKDAYLIDQSWSVRAAGIRQRHIDQAQSMNLYITNDYTMRRLLNLYVQAWKEGVKTIYYVRSKSLEVEECESCAS